MKADWKDETLGRIFEIGSSKRVLQRQWQREGVPFYRAREIVKLAKEGLVENDLFISEDHFAKLKDKHGVPSPGDLMVSAVGTLGACYVVQPDDRFYFKDASVLRFHPKVDVDSRFYQYAFQWDGLIDAVKKSDGATVGTLTISRAKGIPVPLPPLEEQQRIVAVLDEAFEGLARARAHAEANLQNARELFDNFTTNVFSSILEEHGQTTLEEVCEFITDGTHQTPTYFESGYLFLSAKNVKGGRLDWEDLKYIDEAQHIAMHKRLAPRLGDLLIRKNGAGYGGAALVDRDVIFDVYVSLAVLRPKTWVLPEFLLQFANSSFAQAQFHDRIKGQGVPNLHLQEIRKVTLAIPKDVNTQREISEKVQNALEAARNLEEQYEQKLQDLDDLRQSLLQKAFAGELS